jgi:hypothetical protein
MTNLQRLSGFAALVQVTLWAILLIIFFVVLPRQGFLGWDDFNNPAKVASAPVAMSFIVWSDLLFGLTTLISVFVLYQHMRTRMPLIVRRAVTLLLIGAIGWFIAHDLGIHVIGWSAIERDPASTNYAMDRVLWAFRNGVFFAVSLLTFFATASTRKHGQARPTGPLVNSG